MVPTRLRENLERRSWDVARGTSRGKCFAASQRFWIKLELSVCELGPLGVERIEFESIGMFLVVVASEVTPGGSLAKNAVIFLDDDTI
jgi:hypothetical protein